MLTVPASNSFDTKAKTSHRLSSPFVSFCMHTMRPLCLCLLPLALTVVIKVVVVINKT
jgi:hypothetical protein